MHSYLKFNMFIHDRRWSNHNWSRLPEYCIFEVHYYSKKNYLEKQLFSAMNHESLQLAQSLWECSRSQDAHIVNYSSPYHRHHRKYALLYTGAARQFHRTWMSHIRTILQNQVDDVDVYVYVSVGILGDSSDCLQFLLLIAMKQLRRFVIVVEDEEAIVEEAKLKWLRSIGKYVERQNTSLDEHNTNYNMIRSLVKHYNGWLMMKWYILKSHNPQFQYSLILRMRTDSYFPETNSWFNMTFIDSKIAQIKGVNASKEKVLITPDSWHWGGINDQLAILSWTTGERYFSMITITDYLCTERKVPFHPESLDG